MQVPNTKAQPSGWHNRNMLKEEPPDDIEDNYNYFDQDDNSDLDEGPDKSATNIKEDETILTFLYNQMRGEIKGM